MILRPAYKSFFLQKLLLLLLCSFFLFSFSWAQSVRKGAGSNAPTIALKDSLPKDTLPKVVVDRKTLVLDSLKRTASLKSEVKYAALDSIVFDVDSNRLYLYGKTALSYEDFNIQSGQILAEIKNQTMYAKGSDSLGKQVNLPVFKQKDQTFTATTMAYNFKTQKARITGARTQQGDGYILGDVVKKMADNSINALNGRYTTCSDEHPHFYIRSKKMKITGKKQIISGPLQMVVEDFPVPFILPFGFFPNQDKQTSGVILPKPSVQGDRGLALRGGGYYFAINDYLDLLIDGDYFTRGGWRLGGSSRYKYGQVLGGEIGFDYSLYKKGEALDPLFFKTNPWQFRWNHTHKINPGTNVSAKVMLDNGFNRTQSLNTSTYNQTNLNSSLGFSKAIANTPVTINLSSNLVQNVGSAKIIRGEIDAGTLTLDLPNLSVFVRAQNPFKSVAPTKAGLKWLRQLNASYTLDAKNRYYNVPLNSTWDVIRAPQDSIIVYTTDTTFNTVRGNSYMQNGIKHTIPVNTQVKLFKVININPSFNYNEYWYFSSVSKEVDRKNAVATYYDYGFKTARDFRTGVSASTMLYGLYGMKKSRRQTVVRQSMQLSAGYNYQPDFSDARYGYWAAYVDTAGKDVKYSKFSNSSIGAPGNTEQQAINFTFNNVFEAKYLKKAALKGELKEGEDRYERVKILDNLGTGLNYNFAADSFKLAPLTISARTTVMKGKVAINSGMNVDPYALNSAGRRIDVYQFKQNGSLGRITGANLSISTRFAAKTDKKLVKKDQINPREYAEVQQFMDSYVDFDIPWSLQVNYNLNYTKNGNNKATFSANTFNFTGDLSLTQKWKIAFASGMAFSDPETNNFSLKPRFTNNTSFTILRDLHCWDMSFTWIPFGPQQSYSLNIGVKSPTLQALKLSKRNNWQDRL